MASHRSNATVDVNDPPPAKVSLKVHQTAVAMLIGMFFSMVLWYAYGRKVEFAYNLMSYVLLP